MTREEAVQIGVGALAQWHKSDHGERCTCLEGELFGYQASAVIDALIADGLEFDKYTGPAKRNVGPPAES